MNRGKLVALFMVLAMLLALAVGVQGQDMKRIVTDAGYDDVPTLDPALSTDSASIQVLTGTYVGLTTLNEVSLEVEPGIASSWDISDDGLKYTFHLIEGIPWVKFNADTGEVEQVTDDAGNVRYVNAHDVEYGIKRTLNPDTAGDYAYVLFPVVTGAEAYNSGEGSADDVGVTAVDDYTLEIDSPNPAGYALNIYGMWMARPQPQWAIDEYGEFWIEPENYESYGPFTVSAWEHGDHLTLVKNPFWPGFDYMPQPNLDEIELRFTQPSTAMAGFEAGEFDVVDDVPSADIDRIKADATLSEEFYIGPNPAVYYYGFNVTKAPVDNVHVRRALSLAVDRQSLIDNVIKGGQTPARWFAPPALAAAPTLELYPDLGVTFDVAKAQEELQMGLNDMGLASAADLPPITLMHNESENHARIAQAIQQMWHDNLGVDVQITTQEWAVYLNTLDNDPPQIWRLGWSLDYPDANNFDNEVLNSKSANNHTRWVNAEFDSLVEQAATMTDADARREIYAQAEEIAVWDDAVLIPLYWYTDLELTKPHVQRTYALTSAQRFEKWDING